MSDPIDRQDAIRIVDGIDTWQAGWRGDAIESLKALPSTQPERLTDDDFETIRIHLSAYKERLCNQHRWKEAEEYQKIINRLRSFASAQPEPKWIPTSVKPDPDLPEDDKSGYFLVTLHTYGNIGFDMDEYEVKKMRWDRVNGWVFPVHSPAWIEEALAQHVLAWKPCPKPYREDGAE